MSTLTVTATLTYGDTTPDGAVPAREPLSFSLTYTEASIKTVNVAAGVTDQEITFDSVASPKFLFAHCVETDVTIKLSDGVVATPTPSSLSETSGWLMLAHPDGQEIDRILVTTPATPASGARVRIIAFE